MASTKNFPIFIGAYRIFFRQLCGKLEAKFIHTNDLMHYLHLLSDSTIVTGRVFYLRGVKFVGSWGPHCIYKKMCRGPHEVLDLEITTSLGNDLCNVA